MAQVWRWRHRNLLFFDAEMLSSCVTYIKCLPNKYKLCLGDGLMVIMPTAYFNDLRSNTVECNNTKYLTRMIINCLRPLLAHSTKTKNKKKLTERKLKIIRLRYTSIFLHLVIKNSSKLWHRQWQWMGIERVREKSWNEELIDRYLSSETNPFDH